MCVRQSPEAHYYEHVMFIFCVLCDRVDLIEGKKYVRAPVLYGLMPQLSSISLCYLRTRIPGPGYGQLRAKHSPVMEHPWPSIGALSTYLRCSIMLMDRL